MDKQTEKNITVGYINQVSTNKWCRPTYKEVPRVQLSGAWLRDLGFDTGDKIRVVAEKNRIVFEKII